MSNYFRISQGIVMVLSRRFFFSSLLATSCFASITIKSELNESASVETVVEILESCYGKRITSLGLVGQSTEVVSKILWSRGSPAISLIDVTSRIVSNHSSPSNKQHKLQVFVVMASSSIDLTTALRKIKSSIWWNHMATFLILEWPSSGCLSPFQMLWAAWKMNILDAKLICHDREKGQLIYTYNPYTSLAPVTWRVVKKYNGTDGHPWTLFERRHEKLNEICNDLDFDKTIDLGGYKINVSVTNLTFGSKLNDIPNYCGGDYEQITCEIIFPALNATPNVLMHSIKSAGYMDNNGNPHGMLKEVLDGQSDIALLSRYVTSLKNVPISYPHWQSSLHILSQYRGHKSQLSKIVSVVDSESRLLLGVVCLVNIILFRFLLHQSIMVALLSTFRMICNAAFLKVPEEVAPRIYLASLLLFALTMHGIYEGQFASLLTKHEPLKNVKTKEDLVALDYNVYGSTSYKMHFRDPEFQGRFFELEEITCTEYVLKDPRAACIGDKDFIMEDALKLKLHLSRAFVQIHLALPIRPDWPLENRVNTILKRSVENHWGDLKYNEISRKTIHALRGRESELKNQGFGVLTLEQLNFVFAFFGIGMGFAIISFFIELIIRSF